MTEKHRQKFWNSDQLRFSSYAMLTQTFNNTQRKTFPSCDTIYLLIAHFLQNILIILRFVLHCGLDAGWDVWDKRDKPLEFIAALGVYIAARSRKCKGITPFAHTLGWMICQTNLTASPPHSYISKPYNFNIMTH
jgi:hypothetical protein